MRVIWEEYGRTAIYIITAAVLILVTIAMAGQWWKKRAGDTFSTDYGSADRRTQLAEIVNKEAPSIVYLPKQKIMTGQKGDLRACFRAEDADGNVLTAKITDIRNEWGELCAYPFTKPGVYKVKVEAADRFLRRTQMTFCVPVNRGGI